MNMQIFHAEIDKEAQKELLYRRFSFQKKGAIYIPNKPEIPPPAPLPDNIILGNVEWCSDYNEMYVIGSDMYVIGSDIDDIELDEESATSDFDESTRTKKSEKSKKNKPAAVQSNPSATQK